MVNVTRSGKAKPKILFRNLSDVNALDFYYAQNKFCWTDSGYERILCVENFSMDGDNKV